MTELSKTFQVFYAYVENEVIYDISYTNNGSKCAVEVSSGNCPYITVDDNKLYFNQYISDGDKYNDSIFKKTVHGKDECVEKTFQEYYHDLAVDNLKSLILTYWNFSKDDFLVKIAEKKLFPMYMICGATESVVSGVQQIELTDETFTEWKEEMIADEARKAAEAKASSYLCSLGNDTVITVKEND